MELISIFILICAVGYIIYEFLINDRNEEVIERLLQYSPAKLENREPKEKKDEEDSAEFIKHFINTLSQRIVAKSKDVLAQKQILVEAGMPADDDAYLSYVSKKLIYAGFGGIAGLFLAITMDASTLMKLMIIILCPVTGFKLPDMNVKRISKARADSITYSLPDALDLLTICVEAGLGLDSAITRVAAEQEQSAPVLSSEFKRVGKDILAGVPRADAFRNLSKRVASPELRSFMGLLIQSDKLGTSIGQSLKVYSDAMRIKRRQKAEQLAAKASIKMTIPLVLFILPATFIVILAPAALSMIKIFSKGAL
ncbi:MAG: hypothetical protein A2Y25_10560 [Candidatus Melainabacteria bacterium GWF2_37_15]|nr:MAG: hypothetical protein A2Y25_10560 [Candidatus Melainabacteria bacterium GWF2_37_15]